MIFGSNVTLGLVSLSPSGEVGNLCGIPLNFFRVLRYPFQENNWTFIKDSDRVKY